MKEFFCRLDFLWLCLLATIAPCLTYAADEPRVLNAAYISFPPITYTDAQGKPAGKLIELANKLAADSGMEITWREYPVKRIHYLLGTGEIDLWPSSAGIPAVGEFTLETRPLDIRIRLSAYYNGATRQHSSRADLNNAQLILIRGYTYLGEIDNILRSNSRQPIIAPTHSAGLELLQRDRGDYLISFSDPTTEALKKNPLPGLESHPLNEWPLAFIVSKKALEAQRIVDALNSAYSRYTRSTAVEDY
ncbi:MAG TPA: transporter substrate-binding domain-containing protein [Pseudomonas xinjiangensis]|uniref:Transporter substrate-binding domain-containing protein n=2 Tax=root TaxID=1 RepID=A0A7V1FT05_9GAMM|nr:transporter substrate-binding domain-containing protein [Halopseudomonas xinjiangensis]HEC48477.1 transporter substrate-binding domain-containing protein [Halopseudomonas xinjiangensis]